MTTPDLLNAARADQIIQKERISFLMIFCALMLVKNSSATFEQSLQMVPLEGQAKDLASKFTLLPEPS